jgi:hypothetical protein
LEIEIIETPIQFNLHGKSSAVQNNQFAAIGLKLMDEMWKIVKRAGSATTGINHWVYLPGGQMFVGVELLPNAHVPEGLEPLRFELNRYLQHVHIGPYQALPEKWKALKGELAARGETIHAPSLEIYGHHCDDPAKLETTVLIGLQPSHA